MEKFNVRVYGILEREGNILLVEEPYAGQTLIKFPGGGLNFGEGLVEALQREFLEELNLPVKIRSHFYTLDFFQTSAFREREQLLTIYYKVETPYPDRLKISDPEIIRLHWIHSETLTEDFLSLPVDKKVVRLLQKEQSIK